MEDHISFTKRYVWCKYCGKNFDNDPAGIKLWKRHVLLGHSGMKLPELEECPLAKRRKNEELELEECIAEETPQVLFEMATIKVV